MQTIGKRQLRRELRALRGHCEMLNGLVILFDLRMREYSDALETLVISVVETEEQATAVARFIRTKYMKNNTKARTSFDELKEISLYMSGPLQLFFCAAQAVVERYHRLKRTNPKLTHPPLEKYLLENEAAFGAVQNLRDWVSHPGHSRDPDNAMETLFAFDEDKTHEHPYRLALQSLRLFEQFLEKLDHNAK